MSEANYEKYLRKVSLPKGQEFKCQVCGGKGRHYNEVLMSDGTVIRVGPRCLRNLKENKLEPSDINSSKKEEGLGLSKEEAISKKTVNIALLPGERSRICIEISFEKEEPSIS